MCAETFWRFMLKGNWQYFNSPKSWLSMMQSQISLLLLWIHFLKANERFWSIWCLVLIQTWKYSSHPWKNTHKRPLINLFYQNIKWSDRVFGKMLWSQQHHVLVKQMLLRDLHFVNSRWQQWSRKWCWLESWGSDLQWDDFICSHIIPLTAPSIPCHYESGFFFLETRCMTPGLLIYAYWNNVMSHSAIPPWKSLQLHVNWINWFFSFQWLFLPLQPQMRKMWLSSEGSCSHRSEWLIQTRSHLSTLQRSLFLTQTFLPEAHTRTHTHPSCCSLDASYMQIA